MERHTKELGEITVLYAVAAFGTILTVMVIYHLGEEVLYSSIKKPAGNYMFKVNNRNTRTRCEICSKLTIKTPERR